MAVVALGNDRDLIEAQARERRAQSALSLVKSLLWANMAFAASVAVLWLLFRQYTQLLVLDALLVLMVITAWVYPALHRRGHSGLGLYLVIGSFLLAVAISLKISPIIRKASRTAWTLLSL